MHQVSVIIPNYNSEKHIRETVFSCLQQRDFIREVIIIDDNSEDNSFVLLSEIEKLNTGFVKVFKNILKGGNNARNYGYSLSTGKYIQWLDADDELLPGKLEAQVTFLESNPEVDIVYSGWQLNTYNAAETLIRVEKHESSSYHDYLLELLRDNWLPPHAYLLRRSMAEKGVLAQGWNPATRIAQDREFFTTCALLGARFGFVAGVYCIYNRRLKTSSVSRAMTPDQRASQLISLLESFLLRLDGQNAIDEDKKNEYAGVLETELIYHAALHHLSLRRKVPLAHVNWQQIHGMRSKLRVLSRLLFKV